MGRSNKEKLWSADPNWVLSRAKIYDRLGQKKLAQADRDRARLIEQENYKGTFFLSDKK
jgi:hypothetical protein